MAVRDKTRVSIAAAKTAMAGWALPGRSEDW